MSGADEAERRAEAVRWLAIGDQDIEALRRSASRPGRRGGGGPLGSF
jgi:hypothetical protein